MEDLNELKVLITEAKAEIGKVIIGQEDIIDMILMTILANSHALIEGVPGVAKTLLIRTVGKVIDCETNRIQFTPDLMPSDITGSNIFNMKTQSFELCKGPVFTGLLLADEINRSPAKTQSALLQCMQEREVSIDSATYSLPDYFTVFATQNPIEHEGTYPLPEAQKDRFLLKINMGYPEEHHEKTLANAVLSGDTPEKILESDQVRTVIESDKLQEMREVFSSVVMKDEIVDYIIRIVRNTRENPVLMVGAGPRATQAMVMASRINAVFDDRDYVTPDDVKKWLNRF